jgi:GTPase SAR1 family protein
MMAKIYVSSTFLDLEEFREKILFHLQKMKQAVTAMEYYLADDRRPMDKCISDVETCNIYIGIFAWRYGTIPEIDNPEKLSITETEYRTAKKNGIPCLIFLHDGKSLWSPDLVDDDKTRIKAFRKKVESEQTAQWFKNSDELASQVGASLYDKLIELGYGSVDKGVTTFDLEKYYAALRKRYSVLALEGLTPPQKEEYLQIQLRSVFVEQSVRESPPPIELPKEVWEKLSRDKEIHSEDLPSGMTLEDLRKARESYYKKPSLPSLDVLTDTHYQHIIILGDPGSGKSTLARYVMLSLIEPTGDEKLRCAFDGYLPLLIELRTYIAMCAEGNCNNFLEFLEYLGETEGFSLTKSALHNHLKNDGLAVMIFDGLDEIFEPDKREQITHQIVGFCNDYPTTRTIVTSRSIGYRRKILTDAGFTHFTLQDLDENQVESFVTRWYNLAMSDHLDEAKERCERILKSFKESASIHQLAGNPMLLTIMVIIGKHQELPRERWKLYDHAASVLIQHWDVNKHLKDKSIEADFIGEDDKKELLRRLAFRMQSGEGGLAGNYIYREGLQAEFECYLVERYKKEPDQAKVIANAMIQQFRERNFILSTYGANLYGFVHRAFLEYFCASMFVWKFEKTKDLTINQLKSDVYGKHWKDQSWHEVLRLICGMIDEKWSGQIIDDLLHLAYKHESLIWEIKELEFSPSSFSLFIGKGNGPFELPAQCLGELKNLAGLDDVLVSFSNHSSWEARCDFVTVLGEHFLGQPQALALLCERVIKDENENVRFAAVWAFNENKRDDVQLLPIMSDRAVNDVDKDVRIGAILVLVKYYSQNSMILPLLYNCAVKDDSPNVRSCALYLLAINYRDNSRILPFLCKCAVEDPSPSKKATNPTAVGRGNTNYVRNVAINVLAENWPTHPETIELLRNRAKKDPTPWLRNRAKDLIAKLEEKKE